MALDIIQLYISLLSEFFVFSDVAASMSPTMGSGALPALLPRDSNSLTTLYHLSKILGEIQESVNEMNGMEIEGREIAVKFAIDSPDKTDDDHAAAEEGAEAAATNGAAEATATA